MMNTNQTPAFPTLEVKDVVPGMTLRDYFAAAAMPLAYKYWMEDYYHPDNQNSFERRSDFRSDFDNDQIELIAESAYEMADWMLKKREEEL